MIPIIGTMIGAYIITRMLELLAGDVKLIVKVFGCVTIVVALLGTIALLLGSASNSSGV